MIALAPHAENLHDPPPPHHLHRANGLYIPLTCLSKLLRAWVVHFTSPKPLLTAAFSILSTWNTLLFMNFWQDAVCFLRSIVCAMMTFTLFIYLLTYFFMYLFPSLSSPVCTTASFMYCFYRCLNLFLGSLRYCVIYNPFTTSYDDFGEREREREDLLVFWSLSSWVIIIFFAL